MTATVFDPALNTSLHENFDSSIGDRLNALPYFDDFKAYVSMRDSNGDGPFGRFSLQKDDLVMLAQLAVFGARANAQEITTSWYSHWSDSCRSDLDRMEISIDRKSLGRSLLQLRSCHDGDNEYMASECIEFEHVIGLVEEAIEQGRDFIWFGSEESQDQIHDAIDCLEEETNGTYEKEMP